MATVYHVYIYIYTHVSTHADVYFSSGPGHAHSQFFATWPRTTNPIQDKGQQEQREGWKPDMTGGKKVQKVRSGEGKAKQRTSHKALRTFQYQSHSCIEQGTHQHSWLKWGVYRIQFYAYFDADEHSKNCFKSQPSQDHLVVCSIDWGAHFFCNSQRAEPRLSAQCQYNGHSRTCGTWAQIRHTTWHTNRQKLKDQLG